MFSVRWPGDDDASLKLVALLWWYIHSAGFVLKGTINYQHINMRRGVHNTTKVSVWWYGGVLSLLSSCCLPVDDMTEINEINSHPLNGHR